MLIKILCARSGKHFHDLKDLKSNSTINDVKAAFYESKKVHPSRQSFRLEQRGKPLADEDLLEKLKLSEGSVLYYKDLGPQVAWTTVFLTEYAGPLFVYLMFFMRPSIIYSRSSNARQDVVWLAMYCWTFHYAKRLFETVFIHRFSHATMPIRNIVKNSSYYWGFAAFVAYYINHPLYTSPAFGNTQIYAGLCGFIIGEIGNFSIHLALRNLRPAGSKVRQIPKPDMNPFTFLFSFVSCPNYTYEALLWFSFSVMTQSLPALLFAFAGGYQMTVWALGKHRRYLKEFKDYPRRKKAIIPFLI